MSGSREIEGDPQGSLTRRDFVKLTTAAVGGAYLGDTTYRLGISLDNLNHYLTELRLFPMLDDIRRRINPEFAVFKSGQQGRYNLAFTVSNRESSKKPFTQISLFGLTDDQIPEIPRIHANGRYIIRNSPKSTVKRLTEAVATSGIGAGLGAGIAEALGKKVIFGAQNGAGIAGGVALLDSCETIIAQALDPDTATREAAKKTAAVTETIWATMTAINQGKISETPTPVGSYTVHATKFPSEGIITATPTLKVTETPTFTPTFTMTPTETSTPIDPFSFDEILGSPTFSWRSPISKQTGNSTWLSERWGGIQESGGIIEEMEHPIIGSALKHTIVEDSDDTIRAYMSIYSNERKKGPLRVRVSVLFSQDYYPLDKFNYHKTFVNLFGVFNASPQTGRDYSILANVNLDPYGRLEVYPPPPYSGQSTLRYFGRTILIPEQLYNLEFLFDGNENFCLDVNGVRDVEGTIDPAYRLEENKVLLGVIGGHAGAYRRGGKKGMYIYNGPFEIDTWG